MGKGRYRWLIFAPVAILAFTSTASASAISSEFDDLSGWIVVRNGGNGVLANGVLQFSYSWGEVSRSILVSEPSVLTLTVDVNNSITNTIGWGASTADSYQIRFGDTEFVSNEIHGWRTITLTHETTTPDEMVVVSLAGVDRGFWAGWYGTQMDHFQVESVPVSSTESTPLETTTTEESSSTTSTTSTLSPTTTLQSTSSTVPVSSTEPISTTTTEATVPSTTTTTSLPAPITGTTAEVSHPLPQTTVAPTTTVEETTTTTIEETTTSSSTTTTQPITTTSRATTTSTSPATTPPEASQSLPNASENPIPSETTPTTFLSQEAIPEPIADAPQEVKKAFEKQVNIFDGSHDDYIPAGSKVSVAERRTIVAATTILINLPAPVRRKK